MFQNTDMVQSHVKSIIWEYSNNLADVKKM